MSSSKSSSSSYSSSSSSSKSSSFCRLLTTIILIPFIAIIFPVIYYHYYLNDDSSSTTTTTSSSSTLMPPPPIDYGTGEMFDMIAPRYDMINRALALNMDLGWRKVMVREVLDRVLVLPPEEDTSASNNNDDEDEKEEGSGGVDGEAETTTTKTEEEEEEEEEVMQFLDLATGTADVAILLGTEMDKVISQKWHNKSDHKKKKDQQQSLLLSPPPSSSKKKPPKWTIKGVDPSIEMINVGQTKLIQRQLAPQITLEVGDARDLHRFDDDTFIGITMAFGIRNVPPGEDRIKALCEMHRVLQKEEEEDEDDDEDNDDEDPNNNTNSNNPTKPTTTTTTTSSTTKTTQKKKKKRRKRKRRRSQKPTLAILEFSEPTSEYGLLGRIAKYFIRYIVPSLGAILSNAPREYRHLQNSIDHFPSPTEFVSFVESIRCPPTIISTKNDSANGGDGEEREQQQQQQQRRVVMGTFRVDKLQQMNGGSVQLYVATPVMIAVVPTTEEEEEDEVVMEEEEV